MRSIAIINQKGGVGKTTTAANFGHALARCGEKVLMVDLDPQGHLTAHLGVFDQARPGVANLLLEEPFQAEWLIESRENLLLLPSGNQLQQVESQLHSEQALANLLAFREKMAANIDLLILDCPPASGVLINYALESVGEVIIPVAGDYLALRGLSDLMQTLNRFAAKNSKEFRKWIVATRYQSRRKLSWEVRGKLIEYFPNQVLFTPIREVSVLAECPSFGKTVFEYKKGNKGAEDYAKLADDFIHQRFVE